jgi:Zn-dependent peptidase ImmA (M78 family)
MATRQSQAVPFLSIWSGKVRPGLTRNVRSVPIIRLYSGTYPCLAFQMCKPDSHLEHEAFERAAIEMHRLAGMDPEKLNCPVRLARGSGVRVLDAGDTPMPGDGFCVSPGYTSLIFVNARLSRKRIAFAVAHELAEVELTRLGYDDPDREEAADRFGAAILLPRPAVIVALRSQRWRGVQDFASRLGVSSVCAALRLGEVTTDPVAVVDKGRAVTRGVDRWPEPPAKLAKCRTLPPGLFRTWIDHGRVVIGEAAIRAACFAALLPELSSFC